MDPDAVDSTDNPWVKHREEQKGRRKRSKMPTVYARVSEESFQWLSQQSIESGVSQAKIIDAILRQCVEANLQVSVIMPRIVIE
jgi:hypothetical protein